MAIIYAITFDLYIEVVHTILVNFEIFIKNAKVNLVDIENTNVKLNISRNLFNFFFNYEDNLNIHKKHQFLDLLPEVTRSSANLKHNFH